MMTTTALALAKAQVTMKTKTTKQREALTAALRMATTQGAHPPCHCCWSSAVGDVVTVVLICAPEYLSIRAKVVLASLLVAAAVAVVVAAAAVVVVVVGRRARASQRARRRGREAARPARAVAAAVVKGEAKTKTLALRRRR
jgi:hypothetical protein